MGRSPGGPCVTSWVTVASSRPTNGGDCSTYLMHRNNAGGNDISNNSEASMNIDT